MWKKGYINKADIITPWFIQLQTEKNFKDFSRIFQGQITIFKDYDLYNRSAFFNPLLITLLAYTKDEPNFPWEAK